MEEDASLAGSETFLKAADEDPPKVPAKVGPGYHRAILVIPDSRGRAYAPDTFSDLFLTGAISWLNSPSPSLSIIYIPQRESWATASHDDLKHCV